ncbi:MAG: CPBP family intramembrane metalloprotease [Lachnospiraceae bacterium]|nr:CPBP family intramembrane metalloprotease [Lachnospiraceae bacterium]
MDKKRVSRTGWLYLVIMELFIVANIVRLLFGGRAEMGILLELLMSQGMVILPVIVYWIISRSGIKDTFSIRAVRIPTLLLTVLYTIMWYPLIGACNAFTMLFTDNAAIELSESFDGIHPALMLLSVGILGPLIEEFCFRGAILSGLLKSGRLFASVLLSALMFGILHLNLNQMAYAAVMGIAFGMVVSVTGSVWCGYVGHMLINSVSVAAIMVMSRLPKELVSQSTQSFDDPVMRSQVIAMIPILLIVGLVAAGLSVFLLKAMASMEGREEVFHRMFSRNKDGAEKIHVFTLPASLGLILGAVFIAIRLIVGH